MNNDEVNPFTSHGVRLNRTHWIIVGIFTIALYALTPWIWKRAEKFEIDRDYRMPFVLSNDYWQYERYAQVAAEKYDTVVLGDSVIWGQYVTREQTLTHYLNELAGSERFANLGLDGSHPMALAGLIEDYGGAIRGKNVILNCNALWMSSTKHDLNIKEEFRFNHPRLVPQFSPCIPCYKEDMSTRLGVEVERRIPFNAWTGHLQSAYFEQSDIPAWTLEHPYACPLGAVTMRVPPSDNQLRHEPIAWTERGVKKQDFPFVNLDDSLQWGAFRRAVAILQQRGNKVFVLVGPFNEHMLNEKSKDAYEKTKTGITAWLKANGVPHFVPATLPSETYADASHPLSDGYRQLAKELFEQFAKPAP